MHTEEPLAICSQCGAEAPRGDMFGAEPDLLCEACAHGVRRRLEPAPVDRRREVFAQHTFPATIAFLAFAAVLFMLGAERAYPLFGETTPSDMPGYVYLAVIQEPWRLLTSAFLHAGLLHIFFNAWWIWDLGRIVEMRRGSLGYVVLFLGSAVAASAISWIFSGPGVGLSGVVYAIAGFLFATRSIDPIAAAVMNPRLTRFLVAWLILGVVLSETGTLPIGNWAHGGGAVFGLVAGFGLHGRLRWILWPALTVATGVLVYLVATGVRHW